MGGCCLAARRRPGEKLEMARETIGGGGGGGAVDDGVGGEREEVAAGVGEAGEQANWWAMVVVVGWM